MTIYCHTYFNTAHNIMETKLLSSHISNFDHQQFKDLNPLDEIKCGFLIIYCFYVKNVFYTDFGLKVKYTRNQFELVE